jgi:hypothetical protein
MWAFEKRVGDWDYLTSPIPAIFKDFSLKILSRHQNGWTD